MQITLMKRSIRMFAVDIKKAESDGAIPRSFSSKVGGEYNGKV